MYVIGLLSGAMLLVAAVYLLSSHVQRLWRNEPSKFDEEPDAGPWGAAAWRAYRRLIPTLTVFAFPVLGGGLALGLAGDPHDAVREAARLVLVVSSILFLVLGLMVTFLNRPACVVPPHLRTERGLYREMRAIRR